MRVDLCDICGRNKYNGSHNKDDVQYCDWKFKKMLRETPQVQTKMNDTRAREWFINVDTSAPELEHFIVEPENYRYGELTHVIEKSAYDKLRAENESLKVGLAHIRAERKIHDKEQSTFVKQTTEIIESLRAEIEACWNYLDTLSNGLHSSNQWENLLKIRDARALKPEGDV